jgi:tryptophan 2,3-dioxygenase
MSPSQFARFRGELGRASGGQSAQFAELDRRLGLAVNADCPLYEALSAACEVEEVSLLALLRSGESGYAELARIVAAMLDLARKIWKWKLVHLELVAKMLGHEQGGTGGTVGTAYLAGRLTMPFQPLWTAVSAVHRQDG